MLSNPFSSVFSNENPQNQIDVVTEQPAAPQFNSNHSPKLQNTVVETAVRRKFSPLEFETIIDIPKETQTENKPFPDVNNNTPKITPPENIHIALENEISTTIPGDEEPKIVMQKTKPESINPETTFINESKKNEPTPTIQNTTINITDIAKNNPTLMTQQTSLSIQDAILLAIQNNPDLDMALERKRRAGFSVQKARAKFFPTLEFKVQSGWRYLNPYPGDINGDGNNSTESSSTLLLKQLVFDGFTSISEVKRNQQIESTTSIENIILIEEITTETIGLYFRILQFQETSEEASLFIDAMELIMEKITVMQEVGAASMLELDFSKARLASAKSANINAKSSLKDAISNIEFLIGPLDDFDVFQPYEVESLKINPMKYYFESSEKNNSQIRLNQSMQETARLKIGSARGKFYPTVNLVIEGRQGYNEFGGRGPKTDSSILLQANYLIYDAGSRQATLNKANSKYREQKLASHQFKRELSKGIKLDYNQVSSIKQSLITVSEEIIANKKLQKMNLENLSLGEIKIIELIDVEERLFNSQAIKHQKLSDFFINYYNLMTKSGLIKDAVLPQ